MKARQELEQEISKLIQEDNKTVTFNYDWVQVPSQSIGQLAHITNPFAHRAEVTAFTTNNLTKETFLLKSVISDTHVEGLQKILNYIVKESQTMSTFTVHWSKKENGQVGAYNTSYFICHDILEVMDKFFTDKSVKDYVIYDVKLNPIS